MDFHNFMTNRGGFYHSVMESMASAGFPPANTPSSACANCGKLCDHKDGQVPMDAMIDCKMCRVCKSYTYIVCSNKCLKADKKRHAPDCKERMNLLSAHEKQQEKEKSLRSIQQLRSFASEGASFPGAEDNDKMKSFQSLFQGDAATNVANERQKEVDTMREENCTLGLKLRNRQLHHATEMYKQRNNLEKVGDPPHDGKCNYCKKAAKVNPRTFHSNMSRCSKCLLVRYCSRDCQVADRKKHKVECREGKFQ